MSQPTVFFLSDHDTKTDAMTEAFTSYEPSGYADLHGHPAAIEAEAITEMAMAWDPARNDGIYATETEAEAGREDLGGYIHEATLEDIKAALADLAARGFGYVAVESGA